MLGSIRNKSSRRWVFFLLLLLAVVSGIVVFIFTTNGPWGYSDSVAYLVSARNLIKGLGLGVFTPSGRFVITYLHPPLFPLLLSGIGILGVDLVDVARWCNIFLCFATIMTTGLIFLRHGRYPETAILGGTLTIIFPINLMMFTSSISEPLFLFLFSLCGLMLLDYFQKQTWIKLSVTAFLCGLLPLTRYVGVAIVASAALCIFLFSTCPWQERLKRTLVFCLLASIPLVIWLMVLNVGSDHALGGRTIQLGGRQFAANFHVFWKTVTEIIWGWIPFSRRGLFQFLYQVRYVLLITVVFVISIVTWIAGLKLVRIKQDKSSFDVQIAAFFGLGAVAYLVFFAISWLFTVPQTPINERLLMPIYFGAALGLLGCWSVMQDAWFESMRSFTRIIPWLLIAIAIYWYYPQLVDVATQSYENNTVIAYRWEDSQIIDALKRLPADQLIISNKSETVLMWADHPAYDLMEELNPNFLKQNSIYGSDGTDAAQRAFQQGAVLVIFNDFQSQFESTYGALGRERLETIFNGLTVVGQYPDGTIYKYPVKQD